MDSVIKKLLKDCKVEYKTLGELASLKDITLGRGNVISKKDLEKNQGEYPVYSSSVIGNGFFGKFGSYMFDEELITWSIDGGGKFFYREKHKYSITNVSGFLKVNNLNKINVKYLFYTLSDQFTKKTYDYLKKAHPSKIAEEYLIPIPPISVQNEIVKLLDKFTESKDNIISNLQKELKNHNNQYKYYRDKLLTFDDSVEWKKLKNVCNDFIVPMRDRPKIFNGNVPWCRIEDKEGYFFNKSLSGLCVSEDIIKTMNLKVFPVGTVICSCSASLGVYAINTQPLITNQTFIGIVCGNSIFNKYLLYYMETKTDELRKLATNGTIPYISRKKFENLLIQLPSISEQKRIVTILDKFTLLNEKINIKLQKEIDLTEKQYEYYRNKLLSF